MLNSILKFIFGTKNARELRRLRPIVEKINSFEEKISALSDKEIQDKTIEFKERLHKGETLDDILPEAYACVREAAKRTIGQRHFDVQLMGGIVLHQGKIAEMKTGEGKTLTATLPIYLNALLEKGVHVVTVNDYLAKRDRFWMGPIYEFLGLKPGYIQHEMEPPERKKMYQCDVVYVTNNEIGFDYLRDHMVLSKEEKVLRELHYAIIDEIDFVLIDEARTPLIISGPAAESTHKYYIANSLIPHLKCKFVTEAEEVKAKYEGIDIYKGYDCVIDEKNHSVVITDQGLKKCERLLGIKNIYTDIQSEWVHHITQAIRAHKLYHRDVDYIVKDGQVIIVDEFTGRLMPGRRWSDGLHQAIEAKENLRVTEETQTLATITLQNFFKLYKKLAGMTGTAATEANEFWEIYKLDVVVIPTNKPMIRVDHPDVIYLTEKEKWDAIVKDIEKNWRRGRPILVGTRSIEKSEKLSNMLRKKGIPHQVLNAKHHEKEAMIIAQAGKKGAVTIATNMAGRGTDIILGGNPPDPDEQREVINLKGLYLIGTERHEARRIDDQLRGRSGRQGDPGESRFYISLEDELMRLFGGEKLPALMQKFGMKPGEKLEHPWITKAVERAQKRVENMHFDIRKHLLEFDNVMNKQREVIYNLRTRILEKEDVSKYIQSMIDESIDEKIEMWLPKKEHPEKWNWRDLRIWLERAFEIKLNISQQEISKLRADDFYQKLKQTIKKKYQEKEKVVGSELMREIERTVLLHMIDSAWRENLYEIDHLKEGINLRAYGQKDPLIEYKKESFALFNSMMRRIRESTIEYVFKVYPAEIAKAAEERPLPKAPKREPVAVGVTQTRKKKIGRNAPCPCGSGKKYKYCCGRFVS